MLADPQTLDRALVAEWLAATYQPGYYTGVILVDADGEIKMTAGEPAPHVDEQIRRAIDLAGRTRQAQLTGPYVKEPGHDAQVHLVAPLFTSFAESRQFTGAVILCMNAEGTLFPLLAVDPLGSQTAESVLARRDGEYSRFLNDPRHVDNEDLSLRIPLARTDVPAVRAAMGEPVSSVGTITGVYLFSRTWRLSQASTGVLSPKSMRPRYSAAGVSKRG